MVTKTGSLNDQRNDLVRRRVNKVLRHLPEKHGRVTKYGIFLREALRISNERGVPISTAKHPDQYVSDLRMWAEGKNNIAYHRLDSFELTCMFFENQFATDKAEAKLTVPLVESGSPELGDDSGGHELDSPAVIEEYDDELLALHNVVVALEPLGEDARKRVIAYADSRFKFFNGSR